MSLDRDDDEASRLTEDILRVVNEHHQGAIRTAMALAFTTVVSFSEDDSDLLEALKDFGATALEFQKFRAARHN